MELSLFKNYSATQPISTILEAVVSMIREDERVKSLTEAYRAAGEKSVKEASPLFGVAAIFSGGKKEKDIVRLTGLSLVDVDHVNDNDNENENKKPNGRLEVLKAKACADPHTLLCYTTISGDGVRILFRYELDETIKLEQQKQFYPKVFAAGNEYYAKLLGVKLDGQCKNVGRLSFLAHDPEVFVNLDAVPFTKTEIEAVASQRVEKQQAEKRRKRERNRLQTVYERVVKPEVEADGAVYAPGSHNDYVMRVGYKLNQFGFSQDVAEAWATETFADYDKAAEVVTSCYQKTEEHGTRRLHLSSHRGDGNNTWATVDEIRQFLDEHIKLRHNVITGRVEGLTPAPSPVGEGGFEKWEPVTDRVVNSLWAEMSRTQRVNVQDMYRVIESDYVPEFHPFKDYLKTLSPLPRNGEGLTTFESCAPATPLPPREGHGGGSIHELASTVTVKGGEAEQQLFEEYLRKWLVGMVAGWVGDEEVNHVILVLIGPQGTYKTTWFNYLLPPELRRYFYTKTNANRMGRDDLLTLAQYGLVCCEELDTMRPSELNQLKAAVTMPAIDERAAYAHFHEHRKHIASFCGTGNNIQFLSDPSGNRRWLPFEVESIRSPREHPFDYEGIYREAYDLYLSGFNYWFSREEIQRLAEHNRQFETPRLEVELVQAYFRVPMPNEQGEFMSVANALQIVSANISQKVSPVNMGRAFRELGFQQKVVTHVRGYVVVCYTAAEMQKRRECAALL